MRARNIILLGLVILLAVAPLWLKKNSEFGGADDRAEQAITQVHPGYKPWFSSLWEPPSGEVETFLFAVQAAVGAGFIGYYLGYSKARKKVLEEMEKTAAPTEISKS